MRDAAVHAREAEAFYAEWSPAERAAFLEAHGITAVLVPRGISPAAFLGPGAPFRAAGAPPVGADFEAWRRDAR